jgi:hypothetical protein
MTSSDYICMVCNGLLGYVPDMCCTDPYCGCRGLPTEAPICSDECYTKWKKGTPEERIQYLANIGIKSN